MSLNCSNKAQYGQLNLKFAMPSIEKFTSLEPDNLSKTLNQNYAELIPNFYEVQSLFLSRIYKRYKNIETGNILLCFARNTHLEILRQRENNLDFDLSFKNFWDNYKIINKPSHNITSIVKYTGIPKETTRRKIKYLLNSEFLSINKNAKGYSWNLTNKNKDAYFKVINEEISSLSKLIFNISKFLNLNLSSETIQNEIKNQFSFYWYHFLSYELRWLYFWQKKTKDNELLLIIFQIIIPAIANAKKKIKNISLDEVYKNAGKINTQEKGAINATSISDVSGVPRATCIRKLDKLIKLGFLARGTKSKKYFLNYDLTNRKENIFTQESINHTNKILSTFLSIVLKSIFLNNK